MNYKTYLFDFDGTLVDSMPCWSGKMLHILEITQTPYPADIIRTITPLGDRGTAEYFQNVLKVPLNRDEMYAQMDAYALPQYRDTIPLKEGVRETLLALKNAGCSLNVLTASPHKMVDPCLKRLDVYDWFDNVWTCDDFQLTKAETRIYEEAALRLGTKVSEVVFFDDNLGALTTAAAAGHFTVGVFDSTSADFTAQIQAVCHRYIHSFTELGGPIPYQ